MTGTSIACSTPASHPCRFALPSAALLSTRTQIVKKLDYLVQREEVSRATRQARLVDAAATSVTESFLSKPELQAKVLDEVRPIFQRVASPLLLLLLLLLLRLLLLLLPPHPTNRTWNLATGPRHHVWVQEGWHRRDRRPLRPILQILRVSGTVLGPRHGGNAVPGGRGRG